MVKPEVHEMQNKKMQKFDLNLYRVEFNAMACACEIVIGATDQDIAMHQMEVAINEVRRIEQKYSRYQPDSIVSRVNAAAGLEWVECDDETNSLFNYADKLFQISDGLFDITSGVLRKAWDFKKAEIPSQSQLNSLLELIGWSGVERNAKHIKLPKVGMEIDFGGFGKEYAVDRVATMLVSNGVQHGYVNLGGDLRTFGPKPNGDAWVMGIQDPRNQDGLVSNVPITVGALATSGDYERFFELNGQRYCHVISALTGKPVNFWRSVSILAPLSITAGTYTTIAMLKEADGLEWLDASGMAYFAIDHVGKIHHKANV